LSECIYEFFSLWIIYVVLFFFYIINQWCSINFCRSVYIDLKGPYKLCDGTQLFNIYCSLKWCSATLRVKIGFWHSANVRYMNYFHPCITFNVFYPRFTTLHSRKKRDFIFRFKIIPISFIAITEILLKLVLST